MALPDQVPHVGGVADLTAAWCTAALAAELGGARVLDVSVDPVGTGQVADTVRLGLIYDRDAAGPATLIAKVPAADQASRIAARVMRTYEVEANFYRDLAAGLPVRSPRCHHAAHDPTTDAYVVLLEDVAPAEAGDQLTGCERAEVEAAIDELALLHGPRWGDGALAEIDWLHRHQPEQVTGLAMLLTQFVPAFLGRFGERLPPDASDLVERLAPRLGGWLHDRPQPWTIVHGDFRADNLLFGLERVVVVDWQTVAVGPGPGDLAYLLGTTMRPDERATHERELVARYTDGLRAQGVDVGADEVWTRYRQMAFGGLVMAIIASTIVEQTARGDEMFLAMAARSAAQALDLESESLLPR